MIGFLYIFMEIFFLPAPVLSIIVGYTLNEAFGDILKAVFVGSTAVNYATLAAAMLAFLIGKCFGANMTQNYLIRIFYIQDAINLMVDSNSSILAVLFYFCPEIPIKLLNFI